jgi:hypothetical protein
MTSQSTRCVGSGDEPVIESIESGGAGNTGLCPSCLGLFTLDERGLVPEHEPVLPGMPSPTSHTAP